MTTIEPTIITARDTIRRIVPRWLQGRIGYAILYACAIHMDAIIEATQLSVKLRFPGRVGYQSLDRIGRDRRMRRGVAEADATYAARLTAWLDNHITRGNAYTMLRQIHTHFAPNNFRVELINYTGRRYTMDANGDITRDDVSWTPPGDPAKKFRWWLFYFLPDPPSNDGFWGDPGVWGDGGYWGVGMTKEEIDAYRLIPSEWNALHATNSTLMLLGDAEQFDSYTPGAWPVQLAI